MSARNSQAVIDQRILRRYAQALAKPRYLGDVLVISCKSERATWRTLLGKTVDETVWNGSWKQIRWMPGSKTSRSK